MDNLVGVLGGSGCITTVNMFNICHPINLVVKTIIIIIISREVTAHEEVISCKSTATVGCLTVISIHILENCSPCPICPCQALKVAEMEVKILPSWMPLQFT